MPRTAAGTEERAIDVDGEHPFPFVERDLVVGLAKDEQGRVVNSGEGAEC